MTIIGSVFGIIIFALDLMAIWNVLKSGKTVGKKLLWILGIIIFPLIGLIVYYLFGKESPAVTT